MNTTPHVRWMIRRDMPDTLILDALAQESWGEQEYLRNLRQSDCIGMVADRNERVTGCMVYLLQKSRFELVRFLYEDDKSADALLAKLKGKISCGRRVAVVMDVNERDDDTIRALARNGFLAARLILCGADDGSDVIRFEYRVAPDPVEVEPAEESSYPEYEDCEYED